MSDRGRSLPLSLPRRWIGDMLHFAERVPNYGLEGVVRVGPLADARKGVPDPPGWHAIVTKALGMVSMRIPELRRAYLPYPWPRLYEAPHSVASIVFEREYAGELVPHFAPLLHPETLPLAAIRDKVRGWKVDPVSAHGVLRRLVRNAKPPRPVRRLLWSAGLNWNGYFRARTFGTFAVNTVQGFGVQILTFRSPLTSVWYYGKVSDAGELPVSVSFDHRVFDGRVLARAYQELEAVLNGEIAEEVRAGCHSG